MKNTKRKKKKGGCTGKGFDVLGQPSPEAKKLGWERKREAQELLDLIKDMGDMSYKEIIEFQEDINRHPEKYTLKQVKIAQYLSDKKFMVDYLDRHISKAPQEVDVTSGGDKLSAGIFIDWGGEDEDIQAP